MERSAMKLEIYLRKYPGKLHDKYDFIVRNENTGEKIMLTTPKRYGDFKETFMDQIESMIGQVQEI